MPLGVPVGQDEYSRAARTRWEELRVNGIVLRPRRLDRAGKGQDILLVQAVIRRWRSVIPLFAIRQDAVGVRAHEFAWIRVLSGTTDMFQSPGKRAHQTVVVRLPAALLVTVDAACEPVVHSKRDIHSLPFYGGKRKHDERLVLDQFLIARLGRSWTTYGRAIPSRDYFRIADIHDKSVSRGQKLSRRASEKRVHKILRCFSSRSCLSAVVPLRLRTRHPFAVSAPQGLHRRLSL